MNSMIAATAVYKVASLFVGVVFAYIGYRLFATGVYEKAGELQAAWGERRLILKQAAPGTFFALFGTIIVALTLYRGLSYESVASGGGLREEVTGATGDPDLAADHVGVQDESPDEEEFTGRRRFSADAIRQIPSVRKTETEHAGTLIRQEIDPHREQHGHDVMQHVYAVVQIENPDDEMAAVFQQVSIFIVNDFDLQNWQRLTDSESSGEQKRRYSWRVVPYFSSDESLVNHLVDIVEGT